MLDFVAFGLSQSSCFPLFPDCANCRNSCELQFQLLDVVPGQYMFSLDTGTREAQRRH